MAGDSNFNLVGLLLPFDGDPDSTVFQDRSLVPKPVTFYGSGGVTTAQSKFGGASFKGPASLELPANSLYFSPSASNVAGCVDFTVEAWVYCNGADNFTLYSLGAPGSGAGSVPANRGGLTISGTSGSAVSVIAGNLSTDSWGGYLHRVTTANLPASGWAHIAVTCVSNVPHVFINGVESSLAFGNASSSLTSLATCKCYTPRLPSVMCFNSYQGALDATAGNGWSRATGYIDDLRITKGLARYTANFTPPAEPNAVGGVVTSDSSYGSVVLRLRAEGVHGSTTIVDESPIPRTVTVGGGAKVTRAYSKFGPGALDFSQAGSYLNIGSASDWTFLHNGASVWTLEAWVKFNGFTTVQSLIDTTQGSTDYSGAYIEVTTGRLVRMFITRSVGASYVLNGTFSGVLPNDSNWHHIAVSLDLSLGSANAALWIDGASGGTITKTSNAPSSSEPTVPLQIGRFVGGATNFLGYMDDVRLTNGVSRYTTAFTPGGAPHAYEGEFTLTVLTVPTAITVYQNFTLIAPVTVKVAFSLVIPLTVDVANSYSLTVPTAITVYQNFTLIAPVTVKVAFSLVILLTVDVANSYSLTVPVKIMVGEVIELPLAIQVESSNWRLRVPLAVRNYQTYTVNLPLSLIVANLGYKLTVSIVMRMHESLLLILPLRIEVYPAFASGIGGQGVGQVVQTPVNNSVSWALKVILKGSDVSARLTDRVNIDQDESSAAIATFILSPEAGLIDPYSWVKAPVSIYYVVKDIEGTSLAEYLVFSGLVDTPNYDTTSRLTEFTCTDNLQNEVMAMSHDEVAALTPLAKYSKYVFDETANSWDYLQDRLSTYPYAIKLDSNRNLVAYDYRASKAQYEFHANVIVEGGLSFSLANARSIINQFTVTLDTRYDIYRETVANISWRDTRFGTDMPSWALCGAQMAVDAIQGAGATFVNPPLFLIQPASRFMGFGAHTWGHINPGTDLVLIGFKGAISKRFKQNVTEHTSYIVSDASSISQLGVIPSELTIAIEVEHSRIVDQAFDAVSSKEKWLCSAGDAYQAPRDTAEYYYTDPSLFVGVGWVPYPKYPVNYRQWDDQAFIANMQAYRYQVDSQQFVLAGSGDSGVLGTLGTPGGAVPGEFFYNFDSFRIIGTDSERAEALEVLIAQAKQNILDSHRQNRVSFSTLINPFLQRGQTLRVATPNLITTGMVHQIQHLYDINAGTAMTNITLALSASKALGIPDLTYSNVILKVGLTIDIVNSTIRSNLPINQGDLNYNPDMYTFYSGNDLATYPFDGRNWGGYFTHELQGDDREFAVEFPALPATNTENADITVQNGIINADVPNDELYLL